MRGFFFGNLLQTTLTSGDLAYQKHTKDLGNVLQRVLNSRSLTRNSLFKVLLAVNEGFL